MNFERDLINNIPDFFHFKETLEWINKGKFLVLQKPFLILKEELISLEWKQINDSHDPLFGLYASINWRKFVLAVFFADIVSYMEEVEQVSFERLLFVLHRYPQGFKTWWIKIGGAYWPVGYTGWYPMSKTAYEVFKNAPDSLSDRMVVPEISTNKHPFLYLFNYSVAPQFKKTILSKILVKEFVEEIKKQEPKGLACITVSEEGEKVASQFGMRHTGNLIMDKSKEKVFTSN